MSITYEPEFALEPQTERQEWLRPRLVLGEVGMAHNVLPMIERVSDNLTFIRYSCGDPTYDELTNIITTTRQSRFKEEGLLLASAKDKDDIVGENVEILALLAADADFSPIASLRKVHPSEGGGMETLPTYVKAMKENGFTPEGLRLLHETAKGRPVVEIGALWKDRKYGEYEKSTLYQKAFRDAVARNEVWVMGVVRAEYNSLRRTFGAVVQDIGTPIPVKGEDASDDVRLYPVMIDCSRFAENMVSEIKAARAANNSLAEMAKRVTMWAFLEELESAGDRSMSVYAQYELLNEAA